MSTKNKNANNILHVYIYNNGGETANWRYPCHTPGDIQLLRAVRPPPGIVLHDNAIHYSRKGWVIDNLGGGDLDGDLVMAFFFSSDTATQKPKRNILIEIELKL